MQCVPLFSRILSLFAESNDLQFAVPGGLIGVGTMIDPTLTRADRLVGQVLGSAGLGLGLTLTLTLTLALALALTLTLTRCSARSATCPRSTPSWR